MSAAVRALTPPSADTLRFVALQGSMAKAMGKTLAACPYGRPGGARPGESRTVADRVSTVVWRWAFRGRRRVTVSREKDPRGPAWRGLDLVVLQACFGVFTAEEIGAMLGRSGEAVRAKRCRLRKEGGVWA